MTEPDQETVIEFEGGVQISYAFYENDWIICPREGGLDPLMFDGLDKVGKLCRHLSTDRLKIYANEADYENRHTPGKQFVEQNISVRKRAAVEFKMTPCGNHMRPVPYEPNQDNEPEDMNP